MLIERAMGSGCRWAKEGPEPKLRVGGVEAMMYLGRAVLLRLLLHCCSV